MSAQLQDFMISSHVYFVCSKTRVFQTIDTLFYGAIPEFHRLSSFVLIATWTFRYVVTAGCLPLLSHRVSVICE